MTLRREISWNLVSFVFQGLGLLGLQVIIAKLFTTEDLGIFNQVYAVFILFSQLAVGGVHLSVQKFIAEDNTHHARNRSIARAGLMTTVALAVLWTLLFYFSRFFAGQILSSPTIEVGMWLATPGLFCFAINKTLIGMINGLQRMKLYAVIQGLRPLFLVAGALGVYLMSYSGLALSAILTICEVALSLILLPFVVPHLWGSSSPDVKMWARRHLDFGVRGFLSGVLGELNTRVDVLILGYFMDDRSVGIYSFAAIFAEGFSQLTAVVRANYNPRLSKLWVEGKKEDLVALISQGIRWAYKYMALLFVASVALYPLLVPLVTQNADMNAGWMVYSLLALGVWLQSGYSPFFQLLLQTGHPGSYTLQIAVVVVLNIILNLILVPGMGLSGAAIATLISWAASVPLFKWFVSRKVALRI